MTLNDTMELDHIVTVHADGTVTPDYSRFTPDLFSDDMSDPWIENASVGDDWEFFSVGYTGQHGYSGPIMHDSEFIGGRLERDILASPGTYVAVACCYLPEDEDDEVIFEGWSVLRLAV